MPKTGRGYSTKHTSGTYSLFPNSLIAPSRYILHTSMFYSTFWPMYHNVILKEDAYFFFYLLSYGVIVLQGSCPRVVVPGVVFLSPLWPNFSKTGSELLF